VIELIVATAVLMFPTHVGMNRTMTTALADMMNVPHTRGDEPKLL